MPERKDMAGRDEERQVRARKGPATQARSEKSRKGARKGGAAARTVPKVGKRESARGGDTSGDGLH